MITIQQAVDEILRNRQQKLAPAKRALEKSREFAQYLQKCETWFNESAKLNLPPEVRTLVASFPVKPLMDATLSAEQSLEQAIRRLARETVTIGVAGLARQGKSTLLKSLTGLDDSAIPTGSMDFCTAARSEIRNSRQMRAVISRHDRESFFRETVLPYYSALNLSPAPLDLREFMTAPLPQLPASATSNNKNLYLTLKDIHSSIAQVESLLTGGETEIGMNEVRRYVTKDKGNREYLAVRKAIVEAPFPFSEMPAQLRLIDLPGLGEMALNIGTELVRIVAEEADLVLVVKMPQATGAGWGAPDIEILDIMRRAVPDLNLRDWLLLVLNHTNTASHKNSDNIASLQATVNSRDLEGIAVRTCDCSQPASVREEVVLPAMRLVMEKAGALDHSRLVAAGKAIETLRNGAVSCIEKLQAVLSSHSGMSIDAEFDGKVITFLRELRGTLREVQMEIKQEMNGDANTNDIFHKEIEKIVAALGGSGDGDLNIAGYHPWSVEELTGRLRYTEGEAEARDRAASNTRLALARFLASRLDPVFQREVTRQKKKVADKLLGQSPLSRLISSFGAEITDSNDILALIGQIIPERMRVLKEAFMRLGSFNFTYDSNFHPVVREKLHRLDPDEKDYDLDGGMGRWKSYEVNHIEFSEVAKQLRAALDTVAAEIVYSLVEERATGNVDLHHALYYSIKEFLDQILWSEGAEYEWKQLLFDNRRRLWADDYAERDTIERAMNGISQCITGLKGVVAQISL